ncbi:Nn.00g024420.m01.CDS01 [Neocucurbitaria sp. VM-36]
MNHRSDPSRGANKGNPSKKREGAMSPRASKRDTDDEADLTPEHDEYIASHAPLVDALTREIEIFVQRSQSPSSQDDVNDNCLLNLYIRFLPILHDNADGRWKELFSLDTLLRQNAIAPDQKRIQVLKTTNQELRTFTKSGGRLPDNAGLILIRGDLDAPDIPLDNFVAKINNAFWDDTFEGQNYDIYGPSTVIHSVQEHMERYFARKKAPEPIDPRTGSLPRNVLSLQGSLGDHVNLPWAVQTLRYNLLEILKERVQKKYRQRYESATGASLAGKQHSVPNWLFDVTACLRFCLFGDRGALSLNHLDVLNGTWVTCLSGCKLWFVYDGPWNDEVKAKFVNEGTTWVPQGQMKLIVLQPGDTLIMRPGYPIVHSVLTLEDSIMVGGMIWSQDNITNIIENLQYIMHKDRASVTNEHVPKQLPEYIESLLAMDSNDHLTGHNAGHVQLSIEEFVLTVYAVLGALVRRRIKLVERDVRHGVTTRSSTFVPPRSGADTQVCQLRETTRVTVRQLAGSSVLAGASVNCVPRTVTKEGSV